MAAKLQVSVLFPRCRPDGSAGRRRVLVCAHGSPGQ